jgi:hypothetical protein
VNSDTLTRFRAAMLEVRGGGDGEADEVENIVTLLGVVLLISTCI